jgi:hypothetical protein
VKKLFIAELVPPIFLNQSCGVLTSAERKLVLGPITHSLAGPCSFRADVGGMAAATSGFFD